MIKTEPGILAAANRCIDSEQLDVSDPELLEPMLYLSPTNT